MLTEPRLHYRPYEYPELLRFRDAVRHTYWTHQEFSYGADLQDYALVDERTRTLVARSLLSIAQVELSVKLFWARLYDRFPKPEIAEVGMTFAESEVRHANAYAHLLDLLGLEDLFGEALRASPLREREETLRGLLKRPGETLEDFALTLLLFSSFTEHIALFSQFYALMSLQYRQNLFRAISNAVEATSKEENIHGLFGAELLRILKEENPTLFGEGFGERALSLFRTLLQGEEALVDWLFEGGDLPFLSASETKAFLRGRANEVLALYGLPPSFPVEREVDTDWFRLELLADKEVDFFAKRPVAYARRVQAFDPDELF